MANIKSSDYWFDTTEDDVLCRMGGNGPITVTQLMPLVKWTHDGESFLDVGCGSGTTIDAIDAIKRDVEYKGVDIIPHRIGWLKKAYPACKFAVEHATKLLEADKSWDTVWSRHLVDHVDSFEKAMDEHCRVAKKRVICILWYATSNGNEHKITNVYYDGITYKDEYLNQYSKTKIKKYLDDKCNNGWKLSEYLEDVSWQGDRMGKGQDTIICLERI